MELPFDFTIYMRNLLGEEAYAQFEMALQSEPIVSIRLNPMKPFMEAGRLASLKPVPWSDSGYYLHERPTFTFDPLFHAGCYYVQEASSMFIEQVIQQYISSPVTMLDLCAAPGGKSTHLCSLLPEGSLLVSNEVMHGRVQVLAENMVKWGHAGVVVTNNEPSDFAPLKHFFDCILTDVPCSGEGMFRKDPASISEWSSVAVTTCWQRQRRIVSDIWPSLKPGGLLIYSTCTYNLYEDENNLDWMIDELGAEPLEVQIGADWYVTSDLSGRRLPVYRFLPHKTLGEGFFLCVVRKPYEESQRERISSKLKNKDRKTKSVSVPLQCRTWLQQSDSWNWYCANGQIIANEMVHEERIEILKRYLRVMVEGVTIGEIRGKKCIPSHALAMNSKQNNSVWPAYELTYEQAIAYLRKEVLQLPSEISHGYVLVTYRGQALGFVKNLGSRANNLYPQKWRIRSHYLPETVRCL